MPTDSPALLELRENIAIITLNRPRALNAVNSALSAALGEALDTADQDPNVRVIVLTGAGRAFCAGADLKEIAAGHTIEAIDHPEWGFAGYTRHWVSTPTIAAVNGYAMGGGTELMLASDLAVADETAVLGLPEVKRGLFAAAGGVLRLSQQVPRKIALELALTGQHLSAERAFELGLVNRLAPEGTALETALGLAAEIAANAPLSVTISKRLVHESATADAWENPIWDVNDIAMREVFASADAHEGASAFAEKRTPVWTGC